MFKKYRTSIAVISLTLFILYAGGIFGTFAWFLRTWWLGSLTPASSGNIMKYWYWLGDNGWWYGTGYGYMSGEEINNSNHRYASGTQANVGVTVSSGWTTTMTGSFTWPGNIQIVIPVGTIITPVNGWNRSGLINIPTSTTYNMLDTTTTVQWVVKLDFSFIGGALFSKPVKIVIPVSWITSAKIRADHGAWLTKLWLTRSANATCISGKANYSDEYDGWDITVTNNSVTIYTCAASTFIAYTTYSAPPPSWGGGWWGWWGWWWTTPPVVPPVVIPIPKQDLCPKGDFSPSRFDGTCNPRKIVSVISSWIIENNLLSGGAALDTTYSAEYNEAYRFAFDKGITTKPTIQEANMTWLLSRVTMAKMMVNYAINVLAKTLDTSAVCSFTDMATQSEEMQTYAIKACQLWLMGKGQTKFSPTGIVTRAQLGTVLSRLLYTTPETGAPYYLTHLTTLKDKWVITSTDPTRVEKRVYLMLMLMRAAK